MYIEVCIPKGIQISRQKDREKMKETRWRETDRQKHRQIDRQTKRQIEGQRERQREREIARARHRQSKSNLGRRERCKAIVHRSRSPIETLHRRRT